MKTKQSLITIGIMALALHGYSAPFLSVNFEDETVGERPTASLVNPPDNLSSVFATIVDSSVNTAGTGNGLQLYDNVDNKGSGVEYNFVASASEQVSAVRVDFAVAALNTSGTSGPLYVSLAQFDSTLASSARRLTEIRLFADGTADFQSTAGDNSLDNTLQAGQNTFSIFANDYDSQSIEYTGLDSNIYTLNANSIAYWLNGNLILTTKLDTGDATLGGNVGNTEDNLGRFGFYSTSGAIELDYVIDDITVSAIPEPGTLSLLIISATTIGIFRKMS